MHLSAIIPTVLALCCLTARADPYLRPSDYFAAQAVGTCMEPVIRNGSWVMTDRAYPWDSLRVGDVVTFTQRGTRYSHRIIAIRTAGNRERYLVTRGDRESATEHVTRSEYEGRVFL